MKALGCEGRGQALELTLFGTSEGSFSRSLGASDSSLAALHGSKCLGALVDLCKSLKPHIMIFDEFLQVKDPETSDLWRGMPIAAFDLDGTTDCHGEDLRRAAQTLEHYHYRGYNCVVITARALPFWPESFSRFLKIIYYNSSQKDVAQTKVAQLRHACGIAGLGRLQASQSFLMDDLQANVDLVRAAGFLAAHVTCAEISPDTPLH
jgi:hypothetical protein